MKNNRASGRLPFAESASSYMCCCLCCTCHVRTGAIVIGVIDALTVGGNLYRLAEMYFSTVESPSPVGKLLFITVLVLFIWNILAILTLFGAVCFGRPRLLLPKIGFQLVTLGLLVALGVVSIVYLFSEADRVNSALITVYENVMGDDQKVTNEQRLELDSILRSTIVSLLIVVALSIGIELWFFWVMLTCYKYLNDKQRHLRATASESQPMTTAAVETRSDYCCFDREPLPPPPSYTESMNK